MFSIYSHYFHHFRIVCYALWVFPSAQGTEEISHCFKNLSYPINNYLYKKTKQKMCVRCLISMHFIFYSRHFEYYAFAINRKYVLILNYISSAQFLPEQDKIARFSPTHKEPICSWPVQSRDLDMIPIPHVAEQELHCVHGSQGLNAKHK